ncbi:excalibur calcium-binding domain-containing protein [Mycobacterium syngnathidarum]
MRLLALILTSAAATSSLLAAPVAGAYPNCAAARAAGAAPIYAGQPGYSSKLDRDGDGVACETGGGSVSGGGSASGSVPGSGSLPLYGGYGGAPAATGPVTGSGYTTVVSWTGADCIDITAPSGSAGTLQTGSHCGGNATLFSSGVGDQMIGADPVIGDAASLSCEILSGRLMDSGVAGDGHDVNCLTRANALS